MSAAIDDMIMSCHVCVLSQSVMIGINMFTLIAMFTYLLLIDDVDAHVAAE